MGSGGGNGDPEKVKMQGEKYWGDGLPLVWLMERVDLSLRWRHTIEKRLVGN